MPKRNKNEFTISILCCTFSSPSEIGVGEAVNFQVLLFCKGGYATEISLKIAIGSILFECF